MVSCASRYTLLMIVLGCLTACGQAPQATSPTMPAPPRRSASTTTALPGTLGARRATTTPTRPTAAPIPTFLPEHRVSITLNGRMWWLTQPVGIAPMAVQGTAGILWIHFPLMRRFPAPYDIGEPQPINPFFVMYTPLAGSGDDLDATGYRITTLPSDLDSAVRHVVAIAALEQNRFLLVSYRLCQGCQNGGTQEFWRVDPQQYGQPESLVSLLELPGEGGGHFLTFAVGLRWLFWSESDINVLHSDPPFQNTRSVLLDTRDGSQRSVDVGDPSGVEGAYWDRDGKLHVILRQSHNEHIVDLGNR